jgi:hypothetical protein
MDGADIVHRSDRLAIPDVASKIGVVVRGTILAVQTALSAIMVDRGAPISHEAARRVEIDRWRATPPDRPPAALPSAWHRLQRASQARSITSSWACCGSSRAFPSSSVRTNAVTRLRRLRRWRRRRRWCPSSGRRRSAPSASAEPLATGQNVRQAIIMAMRYRITAAAGCLQRKS